MKAQEEKKILVQFNEVNDYIFNIDHLPKWLNYVENLKHITMNQEIKGSYISMEINLFRKVENFHFRISEYEKNKKIRLKSKTPFFFEITIKIEKSIDGFSYVNLKTKIKPKNFLILLRRKKLISSTSLSLSNLENFSVLN